jgi:hypothetical protein
MAGVFQVFSRLQWFVVVTAIYVICHGLTAWVVTPIQNLFLPEITVFASLVYLPHGVRVLCVWLFGWRACLPLVAGAFLSELMFTDAGVRHLMQPVLWQSIAVGAVSALVAFELFRLAGRDPYAGRARHLAWTELLTIGALASVVNSLGQLLVFSGLIFPDNQLLVMAVYAAGDLIGLGVCMFALMLMFRWLRLATQSGPNRN